MRTLLAILVVLALPVVAQAQITLQEAQDEADAYMAPRLGDWTTEFQACVAGGELSDCHPVGSSTVLPNTDPLDSALATVTNDDPGPFVASVCGDCFDDTRNTWVIAGVDIQVSTPVQLQANSYKNVSGEGIQIVSRIQYDGAIFERGYGLFGPAPDADWAEVETIP